MARGWRGVAAGALTLVTLELLVQPSASGRVSSLFGLPGAWAQKFLDPTVPAFHVASGSSTSGSGSGSSSTPKQPLTGGQVPYTNPGGGAGAPGSDLLPQLLPGWGGANTGTQSNYSTGSSTNSIYT